MNKSALFACALALGLSAPAFAYQSRTAFESPHFAIYEVILDAADTMEDPNLETKITVEFLAKTKEEGRYQTTTAIFPFGSKGLTGTINEPMLGSLTIAAYGGEERYSFDETAKYAAFAGLALNMDMLKDFVDQKVLNNLIPELSRLPLLIKDIELERVGLDYNQTLIVDARNKAVIMDLSVIDSMFYSKEQMNTALTKGCKVDALVIIDRMLHGIPLFIHGRSSINYINCPQ